MTRSQCSGWTAWQDNMPGSPPTIHVTGSCQFPTEGYSVTLEPAIGTNPPEDCSNYNTRFTIRKIQLLK